MKTHALLAIILLISCSIGIKAQIGSEFETEHLTTATFLAGSFINDNEGWLADNAGKLWHTANGGNTWSSTLIEKKFLKLDFTDALKGYGFTSEVAYKTTDGGSTWSSLSLPGTAANSIYFLDNSTGFISGYEAIYKTTNGGNNWSTISTGEGIYFLDYYFINSLTGIAVAYDDIANQTIWRTTNGGETWSNVYDEENYYINSVWFTDESTGFAAGYYYLTNGGKLPVINRSENGGLTWENIYTNDNPGDARGEEFIDIRFKNELEGFALASRSQTVYTIDGGATWQFTYDESGTQLFPEWGSYKILDGVSDLYLAGRNGIVTKWK